MIEIAARASHVALDRSVRVQLRKWPQRPPGVLPNSKQPGTWLRGRPGDPALGAQPFLKFPGSDRLRTVPDGMWLHFSPSAADPYADILCIEACSSFQNLLDKRSRFAPSTGSLLAVCPVAWLLSPAQPNDPMPRWRLIRHMKTAPEVPLVLPVRDIRVVFGLRRRHYDGFARSQVAQPHEFFCPMEALTAEDGDQNPAMQSLLARATAATNFMQLP